MSLPEMFQAPGVLIGCQLPAAASGWAWVVLPVIVTSIDAC